MFNPKTIKAIELCQKYSEAPDTLNTLIGDLSVGVDIQTPAEHWGRTMLPCRVTLQRRAKPYSFTFYGSQHDAEAFLGPLSFASARARDKVKRGLLYAILCSVNSEYDIDLQSPEDFGWNEDSIKDMAQFNEAKKHSRALRACLCLTDAERESLPN